MQAILAQFPGHLRTICEFSLNRPPMRAKVDRQSFDELKPGVEAAVALLDWYEQLSAEFIALVDRLAKAAPPLPAEELGLICTAVDCLVLMENQFGGWSACINRFSWFKRTFGMLRKEVAGEVNIEQLNKDINRFQSLIGSTQFPVGTHLTGPLRDSLKKVRDSGKVMLAALNKLAEEAATAKPKPEPPQLRPLPFLIYMADGDTAPGSFNVFSQGSELKGAQRVFKRFPETECAPPPEIVAELGDLGQSVQMQLAVVLQRCPHYTTNMAGRWGGASAEGSGTCCVIS